MKKNIIALAGMPGSRKSLFAEKLAQLGYEHIMLSRFVKQRLVIQGAPLAPPEFWRESLSMRETSGPDILAKLAWQDLSERSFQSVVIDGVRSLSETCYLQSRADSFLLVSVQSSILTRHKRLLESAHGFYAEDQNRVSQLDAHEIRLGTASLVALSDIIVFIDALSPKELDDFLLEKAKIVHAKAESEALDAKSVSRASSRTYFQTLSELLQAA